MRVLIADDDPVARRRLERVLAQAAYEVVAVADGAEAFQALSGSQPPELAVLDWMMPELTGVDICQRVRETPSPTPTYIILVTAREQTADIVAALQAGADDYVTKPFDAEELRARLQVGARVVALQRTLRDRIVALEQALAHVNQLQGLLPICMYCKRIRQDGNYWQRVESYISEHSGATFSHGICPECLEVHVKPELDRVRRVSGR
jgi:DNA-binding response OmpR family regulator